jgi:hypothetical protein
MRRQSRRDSELAMRCGFYPGSRPGECTGGTAATFDAAPEAFEAAWRIFLVRRTKTGFQAWRYKQAWTAEKYRRLIEASGWPAEWRPSNSLVTGSFS